MLNTREFEELRRKAIDIAIETGELEDIVLKPIGLLQLDAEARGYSMLDILDMAHRGFYLPEAEWYIIVQLDGKDVLKTYTESEHRTLLRACRKQIEERYNQLEEEGGY